MSFIKAELARKLHETLVSDVLIVSGNNRGAKLRLIL